MSSDAPPGGGGGVPSSAAVCSGCEFEAPCVSQGLCVDPTVLHVASRDLGASDDDDDGDGDGDGARKEAYLVEGQLVVRGKDGAWTPTTLRANARAADGTRAISRDPMTAEQCLALGIPADPEEARAFLLRARADAVPHGDHIDYLINGTLVHVVGGGGGDRTGGDTCGEDCQRAGTWHAAAPALMDHGTVDVTRVKLGSTDGGVGAGRYMPLVREMGARAGADETTTTTTAEAEAARPRPLVFAAGDDDRGGDLSEKSSLLGEKNKRSSSDNFASHLEAIHVAVRDEHAGGDEPSSHARLKVLGICCPSEVPLIHGILDKRPGVRAVKVIVPTKTVLVEHAPSVASAASIVDALNRARLQASIANVVGDGRDDGGKKSKCADVPLPPWTILIACALLLVSLLHYAGDESDDIYHLRWLALVAVAIGSPPIVRKAIASLRNGVVDINTLMMCAVAGACALQEFGEAAAVVALFGISEWLEDRAMGRASSAMGAVLALRPERATRAAEPGEPVAAEDVRVGEVVLVKPGEKVPLDGVVVAGGSAVDESALTGESVPVKKTIGSKVYGGTVNQGGVLEVEVTALAGDSAVARLVRMVEEAQAQRSDVERAVETFAKHYTPIVVLAAILLATVPFAAGETSTKYVYIACVLLVVACPCALVLSTPVVAVCGLTRAARRGMLVKGSAHLERLGKLRVICVDKTGTLTEGAFALTAATLATPVTSGGGVGKPPRPALGAGALLRWACALELRASHPVATAILAGAGAAVRVAAKACDVRDFATLPGEGASATVDGRLVEVGGPALASRRGWIDDDATLASAVASWERQGATVVWVGIDGAVAGALRCEDATRITAAGAVTRLKNLGTEVIMLTGDNEGSARRVAAEVGIDQTNVHARLSPARKMEEIVERVGALERAANARGSLRRRFAGRGTLAMVGDGVNDAPALGAADVGVAMGVAGAAAAMETADVALLTNDLSRVGEAVAIGRLCVKKIKQNIVFSIVAKAIVLVLSLMGYTGLWEAVVADVGTALVVILNGMTVLNARSTERAGEDPGMIGSGGSVAGAAAGIFFVGKDACVAKTHHAREFFPASPTLQRQRAEEESHGVVDVEMGLVAGRAQSQSHSHSHSPPKTKVFDKNTLPNPPPSPATSPTKASDPAAGASS
jgi:Cd2+/Zn2+-exporting ATPase